MLRTRCAHALPFGATVVDGDGTVYWKIGADLWDDCAGDYGTQRTNSEMDAILSRGGEYAVMDLELKTETVAGWDVEADDYVLISLDFLGELAEDGTRGAFFNPESSQQLWRVAGWLHHGDVTSQVLLDSDHDQMCMLARLHRGHGDGDPDPAPLELTVEGDDVFQVVEAGQRHATWGWEWEEGYYDFVPPRSL
jgi:hypothetical protein